MIEERRTADGVLIKIGDTVWRADILRSSKVAKHHLTMWWGWIGAIIYSTETAALEAAIARERQALKKATAAVRNAKRSIDRYSKRLAGRKP